jgi:hypothetical protein
VSAQWAATLAASALVSALALVLAQPAGAQVDPISIEVVGGGTLFDTDGMYPGFRMTDEIRITNNAADAGAIRLRILDLVSDDNGCNHPEALVDTTCGDGEGELAEQVLLGIDRVEVSDDAVMMAPTILENIGAVPLGHIAPGSTASYHLTFELPITSGNETQTDSLSFDVEIAGFALPAAGSPPAVDVEAEAIVRPPDSTDPAIVPVRSSELTGGRPMGAEKFAVLGSATSRLPRTGSDLANLRAVGLAVLGAGGVLVALARVRRRSIAG